MWVGGGQAPVPASAVGAQEESDGGGSARELKHARVNGHCGPEHTLPSAPQGLVLGRCRHSSSSSSNRERHQHHHHMRLGGLRCCVCRRPSRALALRAMADSCQGRQGAARASLSVVRSRLRRWRAGGRPTCRRAVACSTHAHTPRMLLLPLLLQAVVGAGAAGLVAARELLREGHRVQVLERGEGVGGVWAYTPLTEADPLGQDPGVCVCWGGGGLLSSMCSGQRVGTRVSARTPSPRVPSPHLPPPHTHTSARPCSARSRAHQHVRRAAHQPAERGDGLLGLSF